MATETDLRAQLLDWRQKLETSIVGSQDGAHIRHLLDEVNLTLERIGEGAYGVCCACHDTIDVEQLAEDPLARYCLSCLTPDQLNALQKDLELAWTIQGALLPKPHLSPCSWEVGYHYEAAGPVSGDFCDFISMDNGDLLFLLGDVSGKGIAASVLMAHLHAIFRSLVTLDLPAGEMVERANKIFFDFTMSTYFATLVFGRASRFGEVEICNAGHCPPLLVSAGEVKLIEATGLPVGMFCGERYTVEKLQLSPGDSLFMYTDGLSEARDRAEAEYGAERLANLLGARHGLQSQALIDACLRDLAAFQSGAAKTDDLTIMSIRRL
ncbi:MAG: SpoIIE family protein phosphatase [Pyrinomonadaceae bacterium]